MPFQLDSQNFANGSISIALMGNTTNALMNTSNVSFITATYLFDSINAVPMLTISNFSYANDTYVILDDTNANVNGNNFVVITGNNFVDGATVVIGNTSAISTNVVNSTTIFTQIPTQTAGSYHLYVVNPGGETVVKLNSITYSGTPAWVTSSTLANVVSNAAFTGSFSATGAASYANTTPLPTGFNLVTANGYYYGNISVGSDTTYSFTINAIDDELQDTPKTFNLTAVIVPPPSSVEYLVVAGGGGGSAYIPTPAGAGGGGGGGTLTGNAAVTYGHTYEITVGGGGNAGARGSNSRFRSTTTNTDIVFCYGGGGAGPPAYQAGNGGDGTPGGSGGGGGGAQNQGYTAGAAGLGVYPGSLYVSGPRQGYDGTSRQGDVRNAGAGGGAGGPPTGVNGRDGGPGIEWPTGSGNYYGGGGAASGGTAGIGANGGGIYSSGSAGIVIIRYPDFFLAANNTTGSPTYTVENGYRTYRFTGSGSITWPLP